MWEDLVRALALVLIIEGLLPAVVPDTWRQTMARLADTDERTVRIIGIASLVAGALLFHLMAG